MKDQHKELKKITVGLVLGWIFGVLFLMSAFGALVSGSMFLGITLLVIVVTILPPLNKLYETKLNFKLSRGLKAVIIIICFIIIAVLANSDTSETTQESPVQTQSTSQETTPTTPTKETISLGEELTIDYLKYKVTKVETFTKMGTSFISEETTGKFIKVYLSVTNMAKESKYVFSPRFNIVDSGERSFDEFPGYSMYISDPISFGEQLQPGLSVEGAVVFELPKDSTGLNLKIVGDWLSISQVLVDLSEITDIGADTTLKDEQDAQMDELMKESEQQTKELMAKCSYTCKYICENEFLDVGAKDCPEDMTCCME